MSASHPSTSSSSAPSTSRSSSPTTRPPASGRSSPIHSTALGPALGGTRFHPYATTADALRDVLNLSRGMSYKAALAGLDLGGGKAVIIGDPATLKSEPLLRAYGRHVAVARRSLLHGLRRRAPSPPTWTTSPASAPSSPAAPSRTAARATARCSRRTASSRACAPPRRSRGARPRWPAAPSASPASARSAATWCGTWSRTAPRSS